MLVQDKHMNSSIKSVANALLHCAPENGRLGFDPIIGA